MLCADRAGLCICWDKKPNDGSCTRSTTMGLITSTPTGSSNLRWLIKMRFSKNIAQKYATAELWVFFAQKLLHQVIEGGFFKTILRGNFTTGGWRGVHLRAHCLSHRCLPEVSRSIWLTAVWKCSSLTFFFGGCFRWNFTPYGFKNPLLTCLRRVKVGNVGNKILKSKSVIFWVSMVTAFPLVFRVS